MAWDCGTGYYFDFLICRHLLLNIFPFLVTTTKLIGKLCNNWQSAAQIYLRFVYSSRPLCCANTIGAAIHTPLTGKVRRIKKIRENTLLALQMCPASPKGTVSMPCFVHKRLGKM
jgi:hypothetical protein